MTFWIFFSGIIAPALFWILYFYYKDRYQPEPLISLGLSYILGLVSAFACIQFYGLLPLLGFPGDMSFILERHEPIYIFYSIGAIGFVEEVFKLIPFLFIIIKFKSFDEKSDGVIYASFVALGFASVENFYYLSALSGFELFGRAFASPLLHTIFSSIWGYTIGLACIKRKSLLKPIVIGLIAASVLHGVFDFFTTSSSLRIAAAAIILIIWIWRIQVIKKFTSNDPADNDNLIPGEERWP
jgi:RsiW-degrading membrane proteinase PrsW (M82 family)